MIKTFDNHKFPEKILSSLNYLKNNLDIEAEIYLYGSQTEKINFNHDFDIGFKQLRKPITLKEFALLKFKLEDIAFPYRIDLKNLDLAPRWFIESISDSIIKIELKDE